MASIFLGMLYWMDGKLTLIQDAPQDPIYSTLPQKEILLMDNLDV